ncbi:MAG TPA: hypothetical protein PK228_17255, partial [Saprospiraceae bacterium]|nr:hypothetical protein [Saprospiraceae bacterium]
MDEKPRPDVFLCYSKEDQGLLNDFVERFLNHNKNHMGKLLYDKTAHSGNLHKRFKEFATNCHVALLLVNARFTSLESYANVYEIPILSDRQKAEKVCVIGVLFSDVKISEWNQKGDVYFLQVTNEDMPRTRRTDENGTLFNKKMANYEQIKPQDRNTFHAILSEWITEIVSQNPKIFYAQDVVAGVDNSPTYLPENEKKQEIEVITAAIDNSPFSSIEKILRKMTDHYFDRNGFQPPQRSQSLYVRSYLTLQREKICEIEYGLRSIDPGKHEFVTPIKILSDDLNKRCQQIQELLNVFVMAEDIVQ